MESSQVDLLFRDSCLHRHRVPHRLGDRLAAWTIPFAECRLLSAKKGSQVIEILPRLLLSCAVCSQYAFRGGKGTLAGEGTVSGTDFMPVEIFESTVLDLLPIFGGTCTLPYAVMRCDHNALRLLSCFQQPHRKE